MSSETSNIDSAIASYAAGAPTQQYLKPNSFKFIIARAPKVTWTCQAANVPPINLGAAIQQSPFVDIPHPGDKVIFNEFTIRYLINEDLSNYLELYNWIVELGSPKNSESWGTALSNRFSAFPGSNYNKVFSDGALLVLNSNNKPIVKIIFEDMFPVNIDIPEFDITTEGMEYFSGTATFKYKLFTVGVI